MNLELPILKRGKHGSIADVVTYLKSSESIRTILPNCEQLVRILLTRPTNSVSCERSFSALRRVKIWLRSTMKQERINNLLICHIHQGYIEDIDIDKLLDNFISRNDWRKSKNVK